MKKERGKYLIRARIREMAATAIPGHIGQDRYDSIKVRDPHPFFFGADVAQEGVSTGEIEGHGNRAKLWPPAAIISLARKINEVFVPVFIGHSGTDRPTYGRVVSSFTESGKALVIGYIEDSQGHNNQVAERIRRNELDTVSIEAELILERQDTGELEVQQVESVTGLALGDSRFNKPGFSEARVLASVQEFEDDSKHKQEGKKMDLAEVLAAIRGANYRPDQIFGEKELLEATPVAKALEQVRQESEKTRKDAEKITGERDKLQKANEELTGKLAGFQSSGLIAERLKNVTPKLTEKEAKYVEKQLQGFTPQGKTDEERAAAVDAAIKVQAETYREFFPAAAKTSEGKPAGEDSSSEGAANPNDLTSPAINPFIPGSTAKVA
jgi:hypothetical protein